MTATILGLPTSIALITAVLGIAVIGYVATRNRAMARAGGDARNLHSLPNYYGMTAAMFAAVPALGVMVIWLLAQPMVVQNSVLPLIPASEITSAGTQSLILSDVRRVADGLDVAVSQGALSPAEIGAMADDPSSLRATLGEVGVALGSDVQPYVLAAAQKSRAMSAQGRLWMGVGVLALAVLGAGIALSLNAA